MTPPNPGELVPKRKKWYPKSVGARTIKRLLADPGLKTRLDLFGNEVYELPDGRVLRAVYREEDGSFNQGTVWPSLKDVLETQREARAMAERLSRGEEKASEHILEPILPDGQAFVRDQPALVEAAIRRFRLKGWAGTSEDLDRLHAKVRGRGYARCLSPEFFPLALALVADAMLRGTGGELRARRDDDVWEPFVEHEGKGLYWNPWRFLSDWFELASHPPLSEEFEFEVGHMGRDLAILNR